MKNQSFLKYGDIFSIGFKLLDIVAVVLTGAILYSILDVKPVADANYPFFLVILAILTINVFSVFSVYRAWRGQSLYREIAVITLAWVIVVLSIGLITFATKSGANFSRLWAAWTFLVSYLMIIIVRVTVRVILRYLRTQGLNQKHVVIIGAGVLGLRACDSMLTNTWAGLKPVALFDDNPNTINGNHKGVPLEGSIDDVAGFIENCRTDQNNQNQTIDEVWIALPLRAEKRITELQLALQDTATNIFFIPDLFGFNLANYKVEEMIGLPVMNMSASPMRGMNAVLKRFEDITISATLLIILSPVMLIIAALVKFDSPGSILFKQRRYGLDGKEIVVWKFRSMTVTEDGDVIPQAQRNDERLTKVGSWLRKFSLDELPQLFNVLNGSMSLVGPRPHAVSHNEYYRKKVTGYMQRHKIRPGITGWAQVNGCRGETSEIAEMQQRVRYDIEYISNWSILFDIRILFRTIDTIMNYKNTY